MVRISLILVSLMGLWVSVDAQEPSPYSTGDPLPWYGTGRPSLTIDLSPQQLEQGDTTLSPIMLAQNETDEQELAKYRRPELKKEAPVSTAPESKPAGEPFTIQHTLDDKISVSLRGGYRKTRLDDEKIQINDDRAKILGTKFDFQNDLGLDEKDGSGVVGFDFLYRPFRLRFDFSDATFTGNNTIQRDIRIGNDVYKANTVVDTRLEFQWWRVGLGVDVFANSFMAIGPSLNIDIMELDYRIRGENRNTGFSDTEENDFAAPIPYLGLHLDLSPSSRFLFTIAAHGFYVDIQDVQSRLFEIRTTARFFVTEFLYLFGEFEVEHNRFEANLDEFEGRINLNAWFLSTGMGVRF